MNLKEALEEISGEYGDDAIVVTSGQDKVLGAFVREADDERVVWL